MMHAVAPFGMILVVLPSLAVKLKLSVSRLLLRRRQPLGSLEFQDVDDLFRRGPVKAKSKCKLSQILVIAS
jgi:hypothetical protein